MAVGRIPGLQQWFLFSEDDQLLRQQFDLRWLYREGKVVSHLDGRNEPSPGNGWRGASHYSNTLIDSVFGEREPARYVESQHAPQLMNTCVLKQIELLFADAFEETARDRHPSSDRDLQLFTVFGEYATSAGYGANVHDETLSVNIHTQDGWRNFKEGCCWEDNRQIIVDALFGPEANGVPFVNIQGMGIADEYFEPAHGDVRAFMQSWLELEYPPAPWERLDDDMKCIDNDWQ